MTEDLFQGRNPQKVGEEYEIVARVLAGLVSVIAGWFFADYVQNHWPRT